MIGIPQFAFTSASRRGVPSAIGPIQSATFRPIGEVSNNAYQCDLRSPPLGGPSSFRLRFLVCDLSDWSTFCGSILGTVTDASGAVQPGARAALTSADSGFRRTVTVGGDGTYSFLSLVPGIYTVTIEQPGFKTYVRNSLTVEEQAAVRADVVMQLGSVDQRVEVSSAAAPLMPAENAFL
jgi:Carboxypeptidase regulatory-like domain